MPKKMNKRLRTGLIVTLIILVAAVSAFAIYVSDYYEADSTALALVQMEDVIITADYAVLSPDQPGSEALIFYPGGKVEFTAYLPLLEQVSERTGLTVVLVRMPFNLAVFGINKADSIIEQFPEITAWHIGGHSLGGAMASQYAASSPDAVQSLILLGAYNYGKYPSQDTLTIYGSLEEDIAEQAAGSDYITVIDGGNHAQFGNYGEQAGDPQSEITRESQQKQTVDAIEAFLDRP